MSTEVPPITQTSPMSENARTIDETFAFTLHRNENVSWSNALEPWRSGQDAASRKYRLGAIIIDQDSSHEVRISIPLVGADQLYYRCHQDRIEVCNDPRRLALPNDEADSSSLVSLLQFGAIVPPLSTWSSIHRFTPGRRFVLNPRNGSVADIGPTHAWARPADGVDTEDSRIGLVTDLLDHILVKACPDKNPVVLFSGGVDSGVLAARIAAMGWKDTVLLNYAMEPQDPESLHAEAMAQHLGLPFYRIVRDRAFGDEFINRIGETYRQPFCDISCIPTYELARAAVENFADDRVVLDGTGADGAFGLFVKARDWQKIYRIPVSLRSAAKQLYDRMGLWKRTSGIEYGVRLLARASDMPSAAAAIAQSPSHAHLYFPGKVRPVPTDLIEEWLAGGVPSSLDSVRLSGLDLALVCSDRFAQKNKAIFDVARRQVVYPFLDHRIVELALTAAFNWGDATSPKHTLKKILAQSVPRTQVYRPKRGFAPPISEYLARPAFLNAFDQLATTHNELTVLLNNARFRQLRPMLARGAALPATTISIIWTALFTNLWLHQIKNETP